jgi:hypothetical protein
MADCVGATVDFKQKRAQERPLGVTVSICIARGLCGYILKLEKRQAVSHVFNFVHF